MPKFYFLTSKYQNSENESPITITLLLLILDGEHEPKNQKKPWSKFFRDILGRKARKQYGKIINK